MMIQMIKVDDKLDPVTGPTPQIGAIIDFAVPPASSDWMPCDGSVLSTTKYSKLFKAIGHRYGSVQLRNKFSLPDMRGRYYEEYKKPAKWGKGKRSIRL